MCASCLVQSLCTAVRPPCSKWSCSGCSLENTCNTVKRCEWHVLYKVGLCSYCTGSAEHTVKPQVPRAARKARRADWRLKAGSGASVPGLVACPALARTEEGLKPRGIYGRISQLQMQCKKSQRPPSPNSRLV